ncbi:MAG: DUF4595 domain-containing protein [Bacteroidales bacterium]|nr:DUF4595 domain-containing protein [Bacteroidales bacterium]
MNKQFIYAIVFAMSLSIAATSCSKDDDDNANKDNTEQTGNDQNPTEEVKLVSELKCTVAEFADKYTTLKKGEAVKVTLTDVSNSNIAKVSEILKKMSGSTTLQKAGKESAYIIALYLQSADGNALTEIPAEAFKGCTAIKSIEIPETVTKILADAFVGCSGLETVKLPENVEITEGAFEGSIWQPVKKEVAAFPAPEYINLKSVDYATWTTYEFINKGPFKTWQAAKGEGASKYLDFVWDGNNLLLDDEVKDNYYSGFKFDLNNNGLITKIIQTEIDEGEKNVYEWTLEYNSNSQLVNAAMTSTEVDYYSEWTYTYSEDGKLTECKNTYNHGYGKTVEIYKYTYDQDIMNVHGQYWLDIPTPLDYAINEFDVFSLVGYFGKASSQFPTGYVKGEGESSTTKNLSFEINADGYIVSEITGRNYTVKYNY